VFQESEPWKLRESEPEKAKAVLSNLAYLVRDLAILTRPFIPSTADRIASFLGSELSDWSALGDTSVRLSLGDPEILFKQLDDTLIENLRQRFSGSQAERANRDNADAKQTADPAPKLSKAEKIARQDEGLSLEERFTKRVELRVARITAIERHPDAEKLYVETLDDGSGELRQIVSGLVPYYREEELIKPEYHTGSQPEARQAAGSQE
jgi:methionyl-tRNA synthetase